MHFAAAFYGYYTETTTCAVYICAVLYVHPVCEEHSCSRSLGAKLLIQFTVHRRINERCSSSAFRHS